MMAQATQVTIFGQSDCGKMRTNNEDAFVVSDLMGPGTVHALTSPVCMEARDPGILLAVADGMGGPEAMEVASVLALHGLRLRMSRVNTRNAESALRAGVGEAHRRVWNDDREARRRTGATLAVVFLYAGQAYAAEVGDSRAYLLRDRRLVQLTRNQRQFEDLLDEGALTRQRVDTLEYRHVILQAMGLRPGVVVALNRIPLQSRDRYLLCSDGLSKKVKDGEIQSVLLGAATLESACAELIEMALNRGGEDNVTALLADIDGGSPPS